MILSEHIYNKLVQVSFAKEKLRTLEPSKRAKAKTSLAVLLPATSNYRPTVQSICTQEVTQKQRTWSQVGKI